MRTNESLASNCNLRYVPDIPNLSGEALHSFPSIGPSEWL
jgi:hypothetical protein